MIRKIDRNDIPTCVDVIKEAFMTVADEFGFTADNAPRFTAFAMSNERLINEGMFAIKLYELEQQYGRMQSRLRLCQQEDHPKILQELQKATDEYKENEILLQKNVEGSRSPAVAALAGAQLEYYRTVRKILEQELPDYLRSEASNASENKAEATALYAEYAIDFAVQSTRYALIAALKAIDLQMNVEEQKEEKHDEEK